MNKFGNRLISSDCIDYTINIYIMQWHDFEQIYFTPNKTEMIGIKSIFLFVARSKSNRN